MRISELAARTELPVGTIKFYLREGLLAPGEPTSRTTAEYGESHVERIRPIRALTDAGGLGIAMVRRIVGVLDAPEPSRIDVLATAQDALLQGEPPLDAHEDETSPGARALDWMRRRGWTNSPGDLLVAHLARVWEACEDAGIEIDDAMLDHYADAMDLVAARDIAAIPDGDDDAVHRVVVGTVMLEPLLLTLRMMAHREHAMRMIPLAPLPPAADAEADAR